MKRRLFTDNGVANCVSTVEREINMFITNLDDLKQRLPRKPVINKNGTNISENMYLFRSK